MLTIPYSGFLNYCSQKGVVMTVEDLSKGSEDNKIKISPYGKHLAKVFTVSISIILFGPVITNAEDEKKTTLTAIKLKEHLAKLRKAKVMTSAITAVYLKASMGHEKNKGSYFISILILLCGMLNMLCY